MPNDQPALPFYHGLSNTTQWDLDYTLRKMRSATYISPPKPYKAMLSICSDLDETPDADTYFEIMRFLNTGEETSMGKGVDLEIGNTMYFYMPKDEFSYWNTTEANRDRIRKLIRSGHIDCLHSFGDTATSREHAKKTYKELENHDCRFKVWIDHAQAITNLDGGIMLGKGDDLTHSAYHSDLLIDHGIEYVWRGRATSVIGQNRPLSLRGILRNKHFTTSSKTLLKESAKQILSRMGNAKYALHRPNRILVPSSLSNGTPIFEFLRCNPHWGGVSSNDTGWGLDDVLTRSMLDRLVARKGSMVLYTHLGKLEPGQKVFPKATIDAFRMLSEYYRSKKILVTTTRRLLEFNNPQRPASDTTNGWVQLPFPQIQ